MNLQQFQSLTSQPNVQALLSQIPPPLQGTISSFMNNPIRSLQTIAAMSRMMSMASSMTSLFSGGGLGAMGRLPGMGMSREENGIGMRTIRSGMGTLGNGMETLGSGMGTLGSGMGMLGNGMGKSSLNGLNQVNGATNGEFNGKMTDDQPPTTSGRFISALSGRTKRQVDSEPDVQEASAETPDGTFDTMFPGVESTEEHIKPGHKCRPGVGRK